MDEELNNNEEEAIRSLMSTTKKETQGTWEVKVDKYMDEGMTENEARVNAAEKIKSGFKDLYETLLYNYEVHWST